jgi:hypothetical protein
LINREYLIAYPQRTFFPGQKLRVNQKARIAFYLQK